LHFRVANIAGSSPAAAPAAEGSDAMVQSTKRRKQPPVTGVADVVERSSKNKKADDDSASEEDVSRWLLGLSDPTGDATLKETRTIRLEETTTQKRPPELSETATVEDVAGLAESIAEEAQAAATGDSTPNGKSGWGLFKRAKGAGKPQPGKLPPRTDQNTKDSREAAADILREMQRRR
jgi:hypothetical protein